VESDETSAWPPGAAGTSALAVRLPKGDEFGTASRESSRLRVLVRAAYTDAYTLSRILGHYVPLKWWPET
jgi:hypothetical protein